MVLTKGIWDENKEEAPICNVSSLTFSDKKGFVKIEKLSIWEGVNNRSNSSLPFSECGLREGTGIDEDSGISKAAGCLNFSDEVEIKFLLASFNNCSGSETPRFKGDEGFPRVPIFFEATVIFFLKVTECSLYHI